MLRIVIIVNPGDVRTNGKYIIARGRLALNKTYRSARDDMALQVRQACVKQRWKTVQLPTPVHVEMTTYWPRTGDCDSTVKATVDSLQLGGALGNDSQVETIIAHRKFDKVHPRIEVEVTYG